MGSILSHLRPITHPSINKLVFHPPKLVNVNYNNLEKEYNIKYIDDTPYILINSNSDKYIVFCHGNATDMFGMYDYMYKLANFIKVNIVLVEYPGYSICPGNPTEKSCCNNFIKIVEHFLETVNKKNIYLMGQSLGTGVIINSYKNEWKMPIMLISPYKTIASVVIDNDYCGSVKNSLDMFETVKKIENINSPIKIVHGKNDQVIDISHGKELFKKCRVQLIPHWINADHNDILFKMESNIYYEFLNIQ